MVILGIRLWRANHTTLAIVAWATGALALGVGTYVTSRSIVRRSRRVLQILTNMDEMLRDIQWRQKTHSEAISNTAASVGRLAPGARAAIKTVLAAGSTNEPPQRPNGGDSAPLRGSPTYQPYENRHIRRRPRRLNVAVILDTFSSNAFEHEWIQYQISPDNWREVLQSNAIELLFVESAWQGNGGTWKYHLVGQSAPRAALIELVTYCRAAGIPTVFWNKEDPVHRDGFIESARLFDWVYTTDASLLEWYRRQLGHSQIGVLQFAAQPQVHNPVRNSIERHSRDIAFAGSYFRHRHESRRQQMDLLLGSASEISPTMDHGLEIYSRHLGGTERMQFPAHLREHVVGALDYSRMLTAYRDYKVFLNVNTVDSSETMCARRLFEILASGTPIVSTPSPAIDRVFPAEAVIQVASRDEAKSAMRMIVRNEYLRDRMTHIGQRAIWDGHTYSHRVDRVLTDALGLEPTGAAPRQVSALVPTNRPGRLDDVLETVARQACVEVELVLLTHGFEAPKGFQEKARDYGIDDLVVVHADATSTLGDCMNTLVSSASGDIVAKMDDDDFYGEHYLRDQLNALWFSTADLVGKQARYVYMESSDLTVLRFGHNEHKFTDQVAGATLVSYRDLLLSLKFPSLARGSDSGLLRRLKSERGRIYSADRFNFVQYRSADSSDHTWAITDREQLATSTVVYPGKGFAHAVV